MSARVRLIRTAVPIGLACATFSAGCGGPSLPPPGLGPEPIPFADTLPIPEPAARDPLEIPRIMQDAVSGELSRGLSIRRAVGEEHEARNLTHFDEVVPSAWFEHRNARDPMTPDEVRRGPTSGTGPDTTGVLEIISAKVQGVSPGFNIEDARGERYVVKFDPKGFLHMSSSAGVISNRLLHAAGYHVPQDFIFVFSKSRLRVAEGATMRGEDFEERPLNLQVALDVLARTDTLPDGRYLAVASKFVPGPPKGPFFFDGVRADDPNDHYHHEHRRELRGLFVVSSWINHVDMRWMNTMDAYVPPGYLRHYLIDFAATLGSGTTRPHEPREGMEYNVDLWASLGRVFTLGFYRVGWEGRDREVIDPAIGWLEVEAFDPASWRPNWPNRAFQHLTARDGYWGAKLVAAFTDAQIRAAVEAGRLPTARAADTLTAILELRRDRVVDYWFRQVSPLENFAAERAETAGGGPGPRLEIRFDDLGIRAGVWDPSGVKYRWRLQDPALDRDWHGVTTAQAGGERQRIVLGAGGAENGRPPATARQLEESSMARLDVQLIHRESGAEQRAATVWLARGDHEDSYRVIGLEH